MFSRTVRHVAGTHIFASLLGDGRQSLVYSMEFDAADELAMVLPLPVVHGAGEAAVEFVDLSGYAEFFDDLDRAFPPLMLQPKARGAFGVPEQQTLKVHDVGAFEASFVPSRTDMGRLDPRFQLPDSVWSVLGRYSDWGFAVVRLKPRNRFFAFGSAAQRIHPIALTFEPREPRSLFFPTLHVHDQSVPATAAFDHTLYAQPDPVVAATIAWSRPTVPVWATVDRERANGVVNDAPACRELIFGSLRNDDIWLRPPCGVDEDALSGHGPAFAWAVKAARAYDLTSSDARFARWKNTAQTRLDRLCAHLPLALAELCRERRDAWQLGELSDSLPPHFINGRELWRGHSWMDGRREVASGPGRVEFAPFGELVEPQSVTLGFTQLPDQRVVSEILDTLSRLVDRAVEVS